MASRFLGAQLRPAWRYSRGPMVTRSVRINYSPLSAMESAARGTHQAGSDKSLWQGSCRLLHGLARTGSAGRDYSIVLGASCAGDRIGGLSSRLWGECRTGERNGLWRQERCISGRRATTSDRKLANEAIRAKKILLIVERPDGSKESCVLTRKQALEAAQAAQLDLVQVNGKSDPVVCKLMNAAQEEYRRKKMSRGNPAKKHQKKEIRMKGMIAAHDLERKVNDVVKHLDRGYVVKVVLEAPTSVLKRSLHCLDELQTKFQELLDPADVLVKYDAGSNARSRREMTCSRKHVKEAAPKTARVLQAGAAPRETTRTAAALNGSAVDGVLSVVSRNEEAGSGSEVEAGSEKDESVDDSEHDSEDASEEEPARDTGSGDAEVPSLDLEEAILWEMEDSFGDEGAGPAQEWDPSNARKTEPLPRGSGVAKNGSRGSGGGAGGRNRAGQWAGRDGDSGGGSEDWAGGSRRERPVKKSDGGERGGKKGGSASGTARKFPGKGGQGKFPGKGGRGKGDGWREGRAAIPPPVRSTPYNWRTSDGSGTGEDTSSVLPPMRQPRWDNKPKSGVEGGGKVGVGLGVVGGTTGGRGFGARFGVGLEGVKGGILQQQGEAEPRAALLWKPQRASGTKDTAASKQFKFPPKVVPPSAAPLEPLAEPRVSSPGRPPWNRKEGED